MSHAAKVLVIDDEPFVLTMTEMVLSRAGYRVLTSETADCLPLIHVEQPDLILLDLNLGTDEKERPARQLVDDRTSIRGKIVYHSAEDSDFLRQRALDAGLDGAINKASSVQELIDQVTRLIGPASTAAAVPSGKVLVVDGDENLVAYLERGLRAAGIEADGTTNPFCMNLIALKKPDLVVIGSELPGIAGTVLAGFLREMPGLTAGELIVLSEGGEGSIPRSSNWQQIADDIQQHIARKCSP